MTHPQEGLEAWTEQVHAYRIPRYDELPTLELYMDQVVAVIDDCLTRGMDVTQGGARYNFAGVQAIQIPVTQALPRETLSAALPGRRI